MSIHVLLADHTRRRPLRVHNGEAIPTFLGAFFVEDRPQTVPLARYVEGTTGADRAAGAVAWKRCFQAMINVRRSTIARRSPGQRAKQFRHLYLRVAQLAARERARNRSDWRTSVGQLPRSRAIEMAMATSPPFSTATQMVTYRHYSERLVQQLACRRNTIPNR